MVCKLIIIQMPILNLEKLKLKHPQIELHCTPMHDGTQGYCAQKCCELYS